MKMKIFQSLLLDHELDYKEKDLRKTLTTAQFLLKTVRLLGCCWLATHNHSLRFHTMPLLRRPKARSPI
ncbi:hypothetical protein P3S68_014548 [Capsicum galapagoense]